MAEQMLENLYNVAGCCILPLISFSHSIFMHIRLLTPCLMLACASFAQPAPADTDSSKPQTNASIEYMGNFINLKLSQLGGLNSLAVHNAGNDVDLAVNAQSVTRIGVSYRFISFAIKYIPKFLPGNDDDAIKGKSSGTGYSFNVNLKHWQQELSYSRNKGYYLKNTAAYRPGWQDGDPYVQFPMLVNTLYQGVTAYNFNNRFSVNAIATQTERQLRSTGTFIPTLLYRYQIIDDKTVLTSINSSQKSNSFEILLGAGYYYNFVFGKGFYLALGATPGFGYIYSKLTTRYLTEHFTTRQSNVIFRVDGNAGAGFNGKRFFAGAYFRYSGASFNQQRTTAVSKEANLSGQVFAGYRLQAPKWLASNVDAAGKKIGL